MRPTRDSGAENRVTFVAWSKGFFAFSAALALVVLAGATAWRPTAPQGLTNALDSVATVRLERSLQDTRALKLSQLR